MKEEIEENDGEIEEVKEKTIIVHVTGAVQKEGIVKVKESARINDVIEAAGGLRDDAELSQVNLAHIVEDGQKIYIPTKEDLVQNTETNANIQNNVVNSTSDEKSNLININTANQAKLEDIPGIGSATAQKIIKYREENRQI